MVQSEVVQGDPHRSANFRGFIEFHFNSIAAAIEKEE